MRHPPGFGLGGEDSQARSQKCGPCDTPCLLGTLSQELPATAYRCHCDPARTMMAIGAPCYALTGYEPAALVGNRRAAYGDLIHPADRGAVWADIQRAIAGRRCFRAMYRIRTADRSEKSVLEHSAPVYDTDGRAVALAGYLLDLQSSPIVEEREMVGTLTAGMIHDLRNLLTVVSAGTELLGRKLGHEPSAFTDVTAVRSAAERASCFAGQLVRVLKSQPLARELIELNETIAALTPLLRTVLGDHIELSVDFERQLGLVLASPTQVEQILLNLVANASDAMPEGGVLRIRTLNVQVNEDRDGLGGRLRAGSYVTLKVRDTGLGMAPETLSRILQTAYSTKGSTGIGLTTVNEIVARMGGAVRVSSSIGRGTEFDVYLPRCTEIGTGPVSGVVCR